ncbi:MAG TPA: Rrf2 family transcriptional regulator [Ideonella sp.]|nr:Rrf2 family transcriptional regulator [Ideonella sp.]
MKQDSRLSGVLHVLMHMAEVDGPATSDYLAAAMHTNPVVVRRLMAGLRYAGFVASAKGHGGGWVLSCPLSQVTLGDIHEALGAPTLLAVGHRDAHPECVIEQAVNTALEGAYREAEAVILARLHAVTLQDLSRDFHRRMAAGDGARRSVAHAG